MWCKASEFRGDSQLSTWIMGIADRCALKTLRRRRHQLVDAVPIENESLPAPDELDAAERGESVALAVQQLPTDQRLTLELAYGQGHSCRGDCTTSWAAPSIPLRRGCIMRAANCARSCRGSPERHAPLMSGRHRKASDKIRLNRTNQGCHSWWSEIRLSELRHQTPIRFAAEAGARGNESSGGWCSNS